MKIPFSEDVFDQWRLSQVGGAITINQNGKPEFQFKTHEQYQRYTELNIKRAEFERRTKGERTSSV